MTPKTGKRLDSISLMPHKPVLGATHNVAAEKPATKQDPNRLGHCPYLFVLTGILSLKPSIEEFIFIITLARASMCVV
jgi:hypothetical protein